MKKLQKLFAMLLAVCMVMSLLSVGASAAGLEDYLDCTKTEHSHTDACHCGKTEDLTCTKEEHSHTECESSCELLYELNCSDPHHTDDCYEFVFHEGHGAECPDDCAEGSSQLNCSEQHAHSEEGGACYEPHVHGDACYTCGKAAHTHGNDCYIAHVCDKDCYICGYAEEHTHTVDCLKEDVKDSVAAAVELFAKFPSLQEMKDARATFDTGNTSASAAADRAKYEAYLAAAFAAREENLAAAKAAYDALPAALQAFVPSAEAKLETELPDLWNDLSKRITAGDGPYNWQYTGYRYEYSLHLNDAWNWSAGSWGAGMFMLVDTAEYDGKTWSPDGPYQTNGDNNYVLTYCCDAAISIVKDTYYKRINPEDSTYFDDGSAEKIRAIALTSYPFVPMDTMKATLKGANIGLTDAEIDALTESEIISAVQYAIWYHANDSDFKYYGATEYGASYKMITSNVYHDLTNSTWRWWDDDANNDMTEWKNYNYYADVDKAITAIRNYLIGLEGIKLDNSKDQVVVNSVEIVSTEPVLNGEDGVYSVALKVKLNTGGSSKADSIKIVATSSETGHSNEIPVVYGQTEYTIAVNAKADEEVTVKVEGVQMLPKGVYFYEPEKVPGESIRDSSQNLVGIAMGATPVGNEKKHKVVVEPSNDPVTASLTLKKVNESGAVLTGAEFTLSYLNDTEYVTIDTYAVDSEGKATIVGLLPGKSYQLTESKAPDGYVKLDEAITFTVSNEDGVINVTNLPDDVRCETADDMYILTVVNCAVPTVPSGGGGGPIITPNVPEEEIEEGDVPLGQLPEEEVEIGEEDVPLTELPEEDVPLAMAPATGDAAVIWMALSALSGAGLFLTRKKREGEE